MTRILVIAGGIYLVVWAISRTVEHRTALRNWAAQWREDIGPRREAMRDKMLASEGISDA